jgi:hypothetical protein
MTLLPPYSPKVWKIIAACAGAIVLLALILFASSRISNYWTDRGIRKDKEKIANTVAEISNVKGQISELQQKEAELRGELGRDVETLQNNVYGHETAKGETNKALANYNAAVRSNSNVNATAEDLLKALERIKDE